MELLGHQDVGSHPVQAWIAMEMGSSDDSLTLLVCNVPLPPDVKILCITSFSIFSTGVFLPGARIA